ncbi:hypothetical protein EB001_03955 [bacterium]|nr:hypothetical protein [bacterium]
MALGSVKMILELHNIINNIVPIHGISLLPDDTYRIDYVNLPSEQQLLEVNDILNNLPLELAKINKIQLIKNEWEVTIKDGWTTPNGWKLGLDISDVTLLTGAFTLAKEASNMNINDPISIIDTDGNAHSLTLLELTPLMLQYGNARANLSTTYASRINSVKLASSIEEVELI